MNDVELSSLLDEINEYCLKYNNGLLNYEGLINNISDLIIKEETNKNGNLKKTLLQVILGYFEGKVPDEVLSFYLEKQYKLYKDHQSRILKNIKLVQERTIKKENYFKNTFNESSLPKVSIIITTYNRKGFLKQAIDSFLLQDYPNIELIVIDDFSNDGTDLLMNEYYEEEKKIIYIKNKKNSGPGLSRKNAFNNYADGDYVMFFDDDDYLIDMNFISKAVKFHLENPYVSFVGASSLKEYTQNSQFKLTYLELDGVISGREYFKKFMTPGFRKPDTTTTLFRRESLIKMGISDMEMVNDTPLFLRTLLVGDAGFIDVIVGVYRMHGENITYNCSREFIIENLKEKMVLKQMALERFKYSSEEIDEWIGHNIQSTISYFLFNSAKDPYDFKYMYNWVKENCPSIYNNLKREFRLLLFKRTLKSYKLFLSR